MNSIRIELSIGDDRFITIRSYYDGQLVALGYSSEDTIVDTLHAWREMTVVLYSNAWYLQPMLEEAGHTVLRTIENGA